MEQPRGQQPALLPDQLPDGGRRARLHRGVSARPRGAAAGPGRAVPWPRSPVPGRGLCEPARRHGKGPGRDVRVQARGSCLFLSSFLLFSSFPLTLFHSPFPFPPLLKPLVWFKNVAAWFTASLGGGTGWQCGLRCVGGVCPARGLPVCVISLSHGLLLQPVPEAGAAGTAPGGRQ